MEIISTLLDVEAEGHSNLTEQGEQRRHVAVMKDMCVLVHNEGGDCGRAVRDKLGSASLEDFEK